MSSDLRVHIGRTLAAKRLSGLMPSELDDVFRALGEKWLRELFGGHYSTSESDWSVWPRYPNDRTYKWSTRENHNGRDPRPDRGKWNLILKSRYESVEDKHLNISTRDVMRILKEDASQGITGQRLQERHRRIARRHLEHEARMLDEQAAKCRLDGPAYALAASMIRAAIASEKNPA